MIRRPPRSTRTDTLFPYTTLFRSEVIRRTVDNASIGSVSLVSANTDDPVTPYDESLTFAAIRVKGSSTLETGVTCTTIGQIGRAHVRTPVTNAHLVCRLLLEKKNKIKTKYRHT